MGDRGNIAFVDRRTFEGHTNVGYVFLYTHWGGSNIKEMLQGALLRRQRWDDPAYLTRITFYQMTADDVTGETGYGISPYIGDNEHDILVVDCEKQEVYLVEESIVDRASLNHRDIDLEHVSEKWTFEEFASHGATEPEGIPV